MAGRSPAIHPHPQNFQIDTYVIGRCYAAFLLKDLRPITYYTLIVCASGMQSQALGAIFIQL